MCDGDLQRNPIISQFRSSSYWHMECDFSRCWSALYKFYKITCRPLQVVLCGVFVLSMCHHSGCCSLCPQSKMQQVGSYKLVYVLKGCLSMWACNKLLTWLQSPSLKSAVRGPTNPCNTECFVSNRQFYPFEKDKSTHKFWGIALSIAGMKGRCTNVQWSRKSSSWS